jgi:hypothetical protein
MRRNSRASLRCSVVYKAEEQFILEFEVKLTMNYSKKKKEKKNPGFHLSALCF